MANFTLVYIQQRTSSGWNDNDNNNNPPDRISVMAANLNRDQVHRKYYSAQACAQTQMHSLFPHFHSPMESGERSGAGPTALRAFQVTGVSHHQPATEKFVNGKTHFSLDLGIEPRTPRSAVGLATTRLTGQLVSYDDDTTWHNNRWNILPSWGGGLQSCNESMVKVCVTMPLPPFI